MHRLLLAAVLFFGYVQACSAWEALVDGPDVFGKTKVIATENRGNKSLIVQCDSENELYFAYIFEKKKFEEIAEVPAKFYVKTTSSAPSILEAKFRNWNDDFAGIVVNGRSKELIDVLAAIGSAKSKIDIGFEMLGIQESASFSSNKSRRTMKIVFERCKIENLEDSSN